MDNTSGKLKISLRPQSEIACAVLAGFGIWIKPKSKSDASQVTHLMSSSVPHRAQPSHPWTCKR